MSKSEWKRNLNGAVHSHIGAMRQADMAEKSSLKYVNSNSLKVGQTHLLLETTQQIIKELS